MRRLLRSPLGRQILPLVLTLAAGALFKIGAFARETFITAHFGLTPITDTYFGLQQFPLTLATYMFGAFSRAMTPAYAQGRKEEGGNAWLSGLLLYSVIITLALTGLMVAFGPAILRTIAISVNARSMATLSILAASFMPIVFIGICSSVWLSHGKSLGSMTLTGLPYLVMTLSLIGLFLAGLGGNLSLPVSMTAGFSAVGIYGLVSIMRSDRNFLTRVNITAPWRFAAFRRFISQLSASSLETIVYSASQFVMLYFLAHAGAGKISANNCANRIGMLGFSLLAQPLTLLMQARLCAQAGEGRSRLMRQYVAGTAACTILFATVLCIFRVPLIELIYMRGSVTRQAVGEIADMLPAWLGYFVVLSLNAVAARYMFTIGKGTGYARNMLAGYLLTNSLRLLLVDQLAAPWIVWCAVIGEGTAFLVNLQTCLGFSLWRMGGVAAPEHRRVSA